MPMLGWLGSWYHVKMPEEAVLALVPGLMLHTRPTSLEGTVLNPTQPVLQQAQDVKRKGATADGQTSMPTHSRTGGCSNLLT
jgi:hypothetical protein